MGLIMTEGGLVDTIALSAMAPPGLGQSDVHVWFAHFGPDDIAATKFDVLLDAVERARAARFVFDHHRERFVRAHGLLRLILAQYAGRHPAELSFEVDRYGKPEVAEIQNLAFSLSHSANGVAVAVTRGHAVGIDIELPRDFDDRDGFVRRFFSKPEIDAYLTTEASRKEQTFFRFWTRKEAFLKGIGLGLSRPLDSFMVGVDMPVTLHAPDDAGWSLHHLDLGDDFVGAVACSHPFPVLHGWRLALDRFDIAKS